MNTKRGRPSRADLRAEADVGPTPETVAKLQGDALLDHPVVFHPLDAALNRSLVPIAFRDHPVKENNVGLQVFNDRLRVEFDSASSSTALSDPSVAAAATGSEIDSWVPNYTWSSWNRLAFST